MVVCTRGFYHFSVPLSLPLFFFFHSERFGKNVSPSSFQASRVGRVSRQLFEDEWTSRSYSNPIYFYFWEASEASCEDHAMGSKLPFNRGSQRTVLELTLSTTNLSSVQLVQTCLRNCIQEAYYLSFPKSIANTSHHHKIQRWASKCPVFSQSSASEIDEYHSCRYLGRGNNDIMIL